MNKIITILLVSFSANLFAQDIQWLKEAIEPTSETRLADKIRNKEKWQDIYQYGIEELNISEDSLSDIELTLKLNSPSKNSTKVDSFFHLICDSTFTEFPYRQSGHLTKSIYTSHSKNIEYDSVLLDLIYPVGGSLYPKITELLSLDKKILLPQLINYLSNDAATRLCLIDMPMRPWEKRHTYYLSMSDIALDLIEMKTYCDFFDTAAFPYMLYSNLDQISKDLIVVKVQDWFKSTTSMTTLKSIEYYLDEICDTGYSYSLTCNNIEFLGDTLLSQNKMEELDSLNYCFKSLGNYPHWEGNHEDCIIKVLNRPNNPYKDRDLSGVVNDHINPLSWIEKTDYLDDWQILFSELASYKRRDIPKTLVTLMQLDYVVKNSNFFNKVTWRQNYQEYYNDNFRVCDFALVKYHEQIEKIMIDDWYDIDERDSIITLLKMKYED